MSTSCPFCTSSRAPAGVSATRYSSVLISLATPIRTTRGQYRLLTETQQPSPRLAWMKLALLAAVLLAAFAPAAQAAKTPLPGVITPSGNIHCFYVPGPPGHLLCDI